MSRAGVTGPMMGSGVAADRNHPQGRRLRRDAAANRDRLLAAAAAAIRREGAGVALATIAGDAGVGVGTLYRRYPSRKALLSALTHRSFEMVLEAAQRAVDSKGAGIDSLRRFIDRTIEHGPELVLPLHGGPVPLDPSAMALREEVHDALEKVLRRGREDHTIRPDVTAFDVIVFGALLAQPLPLVPDWKSMARRQAAIYFDGLSGAAETQPRPKKHRSGFDQLGCSELTATLSTPGPRRAPEPE
jgi:AcrR family transcriptional regulator